MKKEEMTTVDFLLEAVGIVAALVYLGLQIYYGIVYGVAFTGIILNAAILILVYVGDRGAGAFEGLSLFA